MSARVARMAGSISRSRARWEAHALTSDAAARRLRSTPSAGGSSTASSGRATPSATAFEQLAGRAPLPLAVVEAPHPSEVGFLAGRTLRHRHQRQVGQEEPHRPVDLGRPPLPPGGQGLGDGRRPPAQRPSLLDLPPGPVGHLGGGGTGPHHLALVEGPLQPAPALEVGDQPLVHLVQVLHVGRRIDLGLRRQRSRHPVGEPVGLGQLHAEQALHEAGRAPRWCSPRSRPPPACRRGGWAPCRRPAAGSRGPGWRRASGTGPGRPAPRRAARCRRRGGRPPPRHPARTAAAARAGAW